MPPKLSKADKKERAREKKEKKMAEQQQKVSREKVEEGRTFLEPEGKQQPQFNKAIACFDQAIEAFADNADAFTLRGNAYRDQKMLEQAIEDYTKAYTLNPQNVLALEGRAYCFEGLLQWDKAITDYTTILSIQPDNDHAFNMRGLARLQKRPRFLRLKNAELQALLDDFRNAVRLNENNFYAFLNLGKAYADHGYHLKALDAFTRALNLKDDYNYALFRRGCTAVEYTEKQLDEQKEQAMKNPSSGSKELSVEEVVQLEKEQEKMAREQKQLLQQAVQDFTRIIPEEKAQELSAVMHRATAYALLGELDKAESEYQFCQKTIDASPPEEGRDSVLLKDVLATKLKELEILKAAKKTTKKKV